LFQKMSSGGGITATQVMQIAESRAGPDQILAHDETSSNILLHGENDKIRCENKAMLEVFKNVLCPDFRGPSLVETNANAISKNCVWKTLFSKR
ncbi:unnamed protein product, partial [Thlaspi arvense]